MANVTFDTESSPNIVHILGALTPAHFANAWAATLNNLRGRNGHLAPANKLDQRWRTFSPFAASLVCFVLTGGPYAPGNRHVQNTNHRPGNVHTNDAAIWACRHDLCTVVRSLFTLPEVQRHGQPHNYLKHFTITVTGVPVPYTYIVRVTWNCHATDSVIVNVRKFNHAYLAPPVPLPHVIANFHRLGL
ncbi:hypothetical protein Pelo_19029 [Pelomyxa schiedti]|nr:hypothetical protein Pelo_19029 [Pelomyxa schiedti]